MSNLNRNPEKDLQLKQSTEQALSQLEARVEGGLKGKEKTESGEYKRALKRLEKNQADPDKHFRNNLRSVSKILGASEASAENKVLALKVMKGISPEKFSRWIGKNEKMAEPIRRLSGSVLLSPDFATPSKLSALFLNGDTVDFYGNASCRKSIGMGDLFPASQEFVQVEIDGNVRVGKRSVRASNGKVGYLDQSGKYIPIVGEEKITLIDSSQAEESVGENFSQFESIQSVSLEQETQYKSEFCTGLAEKEAEDQRLHESCQNGLENLSLEGIENPKEIFYLKAKTVAMELQDSTGFPWQIVVAQAIFESGYGKSDLSSDGNNHFGIKGRGYKSKTTEYSGGVKNDNVKSEFQRYANFEDSFMHHNDLFFGKKRYMPVIDAAIAGTEFQASKHEDVPSRGQTSRKIETTEDMLWGIVDAGYATLPADEYIRRTKDVLSVYDKSPEASLNIRITDKQREKMAKYLNRIN